MNLRDASGSLTTYALACGYLESRMAGDTKVTLGRESICYTVARHSAEKTEKRHFRTLSEARRDFQR